MTNNDHRRTAYTMTKKKNEQHDKQRSQKDSLHNDQKIKINGVVVFHVVYFVFLVIV
jgi:hypothetical protein